MYLTLLIKVLNFFNDLSFSRLLAYQNFNSSTNLLILLAFDQLNSIDEESDQSVLKKSAKRKVILKVSQ